MDLMEVVVTFLARHLVLRVFPFGLEIHLFRMVSRLRGRG